MDVLSRILPVIDNFERALKAPTDAVSDDVHSFIEGMNDLQTAYGRP